MRLLLETDDPIRRYEWQERAACRDYDQELFFDSDNERGELRARREKAAKKICAACPVQAECLRFAESGPEVFGVWGGTTQRERTAARRKRRRRTGAPPPARAQARTRGERR